MVASKKGGINCTRKKKDNTSLMLTFFEDSLCHAVCEFMSDLMKSNLVESRETMIEFLEGLMQLSQIGITKEIRGKRYNVYTT